MPKPECFDGPFLAVDGVCMYAGKLLLVKRKHEPGTGQWALPGGFVEYGETPELAVEREVFEETGIAVTARRVLKPQSEWPRLKTRGHVITLPYVVMPRNYHDIEPRGGDDASEAAWHDLNHLPPLAFAHHTAIINQVLEESSEWR